MDVFHRHDRRPGRKEHVSRPLPRHPSSLSCGVTSPPPRASHDCSLGSIDAINLDQQASSYQVTYRRQPGYVISIYTPLQPPLQSPLTPLQQSTLLLYTTIFRRTTTTTLLRHRCLTTTHTASMPLVVPGLQSKDGKGEDWTAKLMGKSLGDAHNDTVSRLHTPLEGSFSCTVVCPLYPFPCACRTCGKRPC